MKRALRLIALVALASIVAPSPALAQGSRGGGTGFRGGHFAGAPRSGAGFVQKRFSVPQKSVFPQPVDQWKSWGVAPKHHHGRQHVPFTPFVGAPGFAGSTAVAVTVPVISEVVDASTVVYAWPGVSVPATGVAPTAPATLPTPTLVDHPGGWYQLRGDGVTTPYSWVWIPKPPATPASAPDPAPQTPPAPARAADAHPSDSRGPAYHWTDDGGVTTWTNRLERVPKRFREQAAATARPD